MVCLVGPSGCGKSTTLKMVNRLIEPTTGRIYLDGVDVTDADPVQLRRGIGYVIQQVGLFPHQVMLTNVMTVPLLYGESKATAKSRAEELMHAGRAGPGRVRRPLPAPALRRPAPAGGRRACARRRPAGAADGRAVRRGRPGRPRPAAGRVPAAPARARQDGADGHPRHRRGGEDGRPGGGVRDGRSPGAVRRAGRRPRCAGGRVRGRVRRRVPRPAAAVGHPDRPDSPRVDGRRERLPTSAAPSTSPRPSRTRWP